MGASADVKYFSGSRPALMTHTNSPKQEAHWQSFTKRAMVPLFTFTNPTEVCREEQCGQVGLVQLLERARLYMAH